VEALGIEDWLDCLTSYYVLDFPSQAKDLLCTLSFAFGTRE